MSSPTTPLAGPNQADILRGYGEWAAKRAGGVRQTDNLVYLALQCSQRLSEFPGLSGASREAGGRHYRPRPSGAGCRYDGLVGRKSLSRGSRAGTVSCEVGPLALEHLERSADSSQSGSVGRPDEGACQQ